MLDEPLYKDNCCCVFFNDKTNTVRYVFLYKAARDRIIYPIRYVFFAGIDENDDWE